MIKSIFFFTLLALNVHCMEESLQKTKSSESRSSVSSSMPEEQILAQALPVLPNTSNMQRATDALLRDNEEDFINAMNSITDEHERALALGRAILISINNPSLIAKVIGLISQLKEEEAKKNLYAELKRKHLKEMAMKAKFKIELEKP